MMGVVGGVTGGGGGGVIVRFIKGSWIFVLKISEVGIEEDGRVDTLGICLVGFGSEVVAVSSSSFRIVSSSRTSIRVLDSESS